MKRTTKSSIPHIFLILGMAMFFAMGTTVAQNTTAPGQCQRFVQYDTNGDGFIGQNEIDIDQFATFDTDGNGLLNRSEFRAMNRALNCVRNNNGQRLGNGRGQGNGKGMRQQNRNVTPRPNCPYATGTRRGRGRS